MDAPHDNALQRLARAMSSTAMRVPSVRIGGVVTEVSPTYFRVSGLSWLTKLGDCVLVPGRDPVTSGEVVRIDEAGVTVKPFGMKIDAGLGDVVWRTGALELYPDCSWRGRVIDALGRPIDTAGHLPQGSCAVSTDRAPPPALVRQRVRSPLKTGVRVIDLFTPICAGQRIGIFAGSGIGKSTLLAMLTRAPSFDTAVVALVGERSREVREFLEDTLAGARDRAVTVVSTGDESPMMRRLAAKTAMCVAEYFRDRGDKVLLIIDSVTRYAHAARDVALAAGEPPVARGFAPSVFGDLLKLLERAGPGQDGTGSITGVFSVLVDGDDHNDPVADTIRGTLDGHIVLDRAIAEQGRYPAVNIQSSVSRLANCVWTSEQRALVAKLRAMVAQFEQTRDLRLVGGYQRGADPELDTTVNLVPKIYEAMKQRFEDPPSVDAFQDVARGLAA